MKRIAFQLMLLMLPMIVTPSYGVTYPFPHHEAAQINSDAILRVGSKVYLFHSGNECCKTIGTDDVLSVYQEYPPDFSQEVRVVGKVRILCAAGAHYFKAEVIEGKIQPGNLAKRGNVACIVTSLVRNSRQ